ncbi:MAG: UDP-N-acetylmuramoyl-L-alanyl-D-glutamate--2,6-diaminopimelate ligase [Hydrogenophaga sp.]|uniref:UDP-N-acetylmuramoyl-L-alanyl-D-glutamate--2, 6-diaminopimelate ligase n=1 Tax=Hydrogenophaga sp. TaxID=1904254 RepID=UPI00257C5A65|nr:UDP-N-acetylmuramoyl-L-alanyl-D-glutamate--2,6-diaminopimelate ligase [Hydrogenophaga sp.]MBL0945624.1 UDP-N-acetylmuramoyl-L-alanyl-D-glutamate--2,6-diaminopimelate ligase [Hydrogenophaga sp.]
MVQTLVHPQAVATWLRSSVTGALVCDSRRVGAGDGFVAWPGAATDGRRFVPDALHAGAAVALVEREGLEAHDFRDDPRVLAVPGLKGQAGPIASAFCREPSAALDVIAITGTNGKTSSAWWIAQLLGACARPAAVVGTLGMGRPGEALVATGLTTPDPVMLQHQLRDFVDQGLRAVAIEASSIGVVEGRLNGTRVSVAVFTNFTQDHLDYHGSMEAYWAAKQRLFDWPGLKAAVVNADDPQGAGLLERLTGRGLDLWSVGIDHPARLQAQHLTVTPAGVAFDLVERNRQGQVQSQRSMSLPLVGRYNVHNLLGVIATARALGIPLATAVEACGAITPVPGRMEQARPASASAPLVLVDYAHTPDALEKALQALRPQAQARGGLLWVVVGCGGDRDPGKRPLMAAVAEREADRAVLTSDNPRSEAPEAILAQMAAGLSSPQAARTVVDRAEAIALAVREAAPADVVLIAGKGHEDYQEIRGVKTPFADIEHARRALDTRQGAAA